MFNSARFIGPAIAGLLIAHVGIAAAFAANAFGYIAFQISLANLRDIPALPVRAAQNAVRASLEAFSYVARHPGIGPMLLLFAVTAIGTRGFIELFPGFADSVFHRGPQGLAMLTSTVGLGAICGGAWMLVRSQISGLTTVVLANTLLMSLAILAFTATDRFFLALPCVFVAGAAMTITGTGAQTLIQAAVDRRMRGRVMALYGMIFRAGPALGAVMIGMASEHLGLRLPLAIGALVSCGFWALTLHRRKAIAAALESPPPAPDIPRRGCRGGAGRAGRVVPRLLCSGSAIARRHWCGGWGRNGASPAPAAAAKAACGSTATIRSRTRRLPASPISWSRSRPTSTATRFSIFTAATSPRPAEAELARLSVDDRGVRHARRRLGRRDLRAPADRRARPAPGRRGRRLAGPSEKAPGCRCISSASPGFTGRAAARSTRCAPAPRSGSTPGQVFSRIHVDDLASVLVASIARPRPGAIYNVCDDEPAAPEAVVAHAASLLGLPAPPLVPFEAAGLSPMARSFYDDNKRVANALIKTELGVALGYPNYRAGLAAILAAGG